MKRIKQYSATQYTLLFLTIFSISSLQTANAINVITKVAVNNKSSELIIRDRKFTPTFTTLDLSATTAFDRYFVTFNAESSVKDAVLTDGRDNNGPTSYSRQDYNVTFGYNFDFATVFGGLRTGNTDAKYATLTSKKVGTETIYKLENKAFGTESSGFYIGISKGIRFEGKGNLSASLAIASLDGTVSLSEPFVNTSQFLVGPPPPENINGSAIGTSIAVTWSGKVSDNVDYSISLKNNSFNFTDNVLFGGLDLSYQENFTTFSLGLTHFFD